MGQVLGLRVKIFGKIVFSAVIVIISDFGREGKL